MIKLLPFIVIPILLIAGGFYYFKVQGDQKKEVSIQNSDVEEQQQPKEVPSTLPDSTLEERVAALEKALGGSKLASPLPKSQASSSIDSRIGALEATVTELKVTVSNLEKATPAPVSSSKSTVYIPLGSGGYWGNTDWYTLAEYEVSLDPGNYPGYTGMFLEVIFRLAEAAGTGYVRLYNVTDNSAISSELSTTSTSFGLKTSSVFTLPSGSKTYRLQIKSSEGKDLYIQSARIKVNF